MGKIEMITITEEDRFKIFNLLGRIKDMSRFLKDDEEDIDYVKFLAGERLDKEIKEVEKILDLVGVTVSA